MCVALAVVGEELHETVDVVKALEGRLQGGPVAAVTSEKDLERLLAGTSIDGIVTLPNAPGTLVDAVLDRVDAWGDGEEGSHIPALMLQADWPEAVADGDDLQDSFVERVALGPDRRDRDTVVETVLQWTSDVAVGNTTGETLDAFHLSPDAMLLLDDEGAIRSVNEAASTLVAPDDDPEGVIGRSMASFVQEGTSFDRDWHRFCPGSVDRGTVVASFDGREEVYLEYAARLDVSPGHHLLVLRDVTDRVRSERALDTLHETTRQLVDAERRADVCEAAVSAASRQLKLPIVGIWIREGEDSLTPIAISARLAELLEDEPPTFRPGSGGVWTAFESGELRISDHSGTESGVLDGPSPVEGEMLVPLGEYGLLYVGATEGGLFGWTTVRLTQLLAANVASALESIERETALIEQTEQLRRQNDRLDEVASVLSHDLRNPLNVVTGHIDLLERDGAVESTEIEPIREALARMDHLISDVLTMAREGTAIVEPEPVDLEQVVRDAWRTSDVAGAAIVLQDDLGTIEADAGRLRTLLENLFRNAIEHGDPTATVTVGPLETGGFFVADDGDGIPGAVRDDIFDFGFSTAETGTGIGLSIVASIAEAHGWTVGIAEAADGGARFEIYTASGSAE